MFHLVWYSMSKWDRSFTSPTACDVFSFSAPQASIFIDFEPSVQTNARRSDKNPEGIAVVAGMCVLKGWKNPRLLMLDDDDHDCPFF